MPLKGYRKAPSPQPQDLDAKGGYWRLPEAALPAPQLRGLDAWIPTTPPPDSCLQEEQERRRKEFEARYSDLIQAVVSPLIRSGNDDWFSRFNLRAVGDEERIINNLSSGEIEKLGEVCGNRYTVASLLEAGGYKLVSTTPRITDPLSLSVFPGRASWNLADRNELRAAIGFLRTCASLGLKKAIILCGKPVARKRKKPQKRPPQISRRKGYNGFGGLALQSYSTQTAGGSINVGYPTRTVGGPINFKLELP